MNKLFTLSIMLVAGAITTPAPGVELLRGLLSRSNEEVVMGGDYAMPAQTTMYDKSNYPYYNSCCEAASPCCGGLWDGYCGHRPWGFHGLFGCHKGCGYGMGAGGCLGYGHSTCGKGLCADDCCGKGHHGLGWWGLRHHRRLKGDVCCGSGYGKGGWSYGSSSYGAPVESWEAPAPAEVVPSPAEVAPPPVVPPPVTESSALRMFPRLRQISF